MLSGHFRHTAFQCLDFSDQHLTLGTISTGEWIASSFFSYRVRFCSEDVPYFLWQSRAHGCLMLAHRGCRQEVCPVAQTGSCLPVFGTDLGIGLSHYFCELYILLMILFSLMCSLVCCLASTTLCFKSPTVQRFPGMSLTRARRMGTAVHCLFPTFPSAPRQLFY